MLRAIGFLTAITWIMAIPQWLPAQSWPSQLTNTPSLVQDGFGSGGFLLPNDGLEYCVPTSTSMSLFYLGNAGFNQIAPANATEAQHLNMVRIMAGLMQTTPGGGTNSNNKARGVATYLAACGLGAPTTITTGAGGSIVSMSNANYTLQYIDNPTVADMNTLFQPPLQTNQITVGQLGIGWFRSSDGGNTFSRSGGHGISLLGVQNVAAQQIIINNPLPHSLAPVPALPAYVTQYAQMGPHTGVLNGVSGNPIVIKNTQYGFSLPSTSQAVIQLAFQITINQSQLSSNNPVVNAWLMDGVQSINTNNGNLSVIASLQDGSSAGGITKIGPGILTLTNATAASTTGKFTVLGGTLRTTNASATPLGTGAVELDYGSLALTPATNASIAQSLASGVSNQFTYGGGGVLSLSPASGQNLTVTLGGLVGGSTQNIVRTGNGTLAIAPTAGIGQLGVTTFLNAAGQGGNLPQVTNGMVSPTLVGQDTSASAASGDFLTYHTNAAGQATTGFGVAAYTSSVTTPINSSSITSSTVYSAEANQTVASGNTVSVYALKVGTAASGPVAIGSGGGTTALAVGPQTSGQAGVILNAGSINTTSLQFGAAEAVIFSSLAGGTISSQIQGTGGLTKFGPGALTISGSNTYTGATQVQAGTLTVNGTLGSAPAPTPVTVNTGAALQIGTGGIVNGSVAALNGGVVALNGGSLGAPAGGSFPAAAVNVDTYSALRGNGTVHAAATVNGIINPGGTPGTMTFTGPAKFTGSTFFEWKLFQFADNSSPNPGGKPWNDLHFTGSGLDLLLGSSGMGNQFNVVLDLSAIADPNSGNPFWDQEHHWTVLTTTNAPHEIGYSLSASAFSQGRFGLSHSLATGLVINYAPVPEPSTLMYLMLASIGALPIVRRRASRRRRHQALS